MNRIVKSLWLLLVLSLYAACAAASGGERLGGDVHPRHYEAELQLDPDADAFRALVLIDIEVTAPTRRVRLHASGLRVATVSLINAQGQTRPLRFETLDATGTSEVHDGNAIMPGAYRLKFEYSADYATSLNGLYKVVHKGRPYLFTHFQPIAARTAFPLFDEPAFKASWLLRFQVPQKYRVLANGTQVDVSDAADGSRSWRFSPTPALPSYAVAFAVGEFDELVGADVPPSAVRSSPLPVRAYAAKGEAGRMAYALSTTADLVRKMETFLGTAFPYEKLDIVAVPEFMPAGMENAALLFYRSAMVQLGEDATAVQRKDFQILHAHELAHQWLGNATSIRWWNDLWLNEGFATWLAHYIVDGPGFKSSSARIALQRQMRNDALSSALPLRLQVPDTRSIETAFERASYEKAAFLIDILYRRHGEARMRAAIGRLLDASTDGRYDADKWLAALRDGISPEAAQWFEAYSTQPGIPLLIAQDQCGQQPPRLVVRQARHLLDTTESAGETWPLEVCVLSDGRRACSRFDEAQRQELHFDVCGRVRPTIDLSADDYAVWALDDSQWRRLLRNEVPGDSPKYFGHLAASLRQGTVSPDQFVDLLPRTVSGKNVALAIDDLKLLLDQVADSQDRKRIVRMFDRAFAPVVDGLISGIDSDTSGAMSNEDQRLLYFLALDLRHPEIRRALLDQSRRWMTRRSKESASPSPQGGIGAAFSVGVQEMGAPFWDMLLAELGRTSDGFSRAMLIQGLAAANTDELAPRVHALVLGPEVPLAEKPILLFNHLALDGNPQRMFDWLKQNWPALQAGLPPQYLAQTVTLVDGLCEEDSAEQVRAFFATRVEGLPGGRHVLDTVGAKIAVCARFKSRHAERH